MNSRYNDLLPAKETNQPIAKLHLLDVTISHPPPSLPTGLNERLIDSKILAIFLDRSHITSMTEKYHGKMTSSATQTDTITTITEIRNYALIPITIDHLGRILLVGMPDTQFPPPKPPWNKSADLSETNEFTFKAYSGRYTFATNSPQHLAFFCWLTDGDDHSFFLFPSWRTTKSSLANPTQISL